MSRGDKGKDGYIFFLLFPLEEGTYHILFILNKKKEGIVKTGLAIYAAAF